MTFAPSDLAGLRVWLRAKDLGSGGSNVTTWPDQSGTANDATAPGTAPTVAASSTPGGGKSVSFGGRALNLARSVAGSIASATASSEPAGSGFGAAKAIDGDRTGSRWLGNDSTGGSPQWLRLNMSAAVVVTYYKIWGHSSSTAYNPTDWKFQGTNDGTFATWTDLDTQSGITWASTSDTKEFTFSNSTAYAWYRILITGNVSATDFTAISEIILTPDATQAELWVVVKAASQTANTQPWQIGAGASSQPTIYPWSNAQIVDNFGVTTHSDLWTPTLDVSQWRLYRVRVDTGQLDAWLDNSLQKTKTGLTMGWAGAPVISNNFLGNIAEFVVVVGSVLSSGEVGDMIAYFNSEHGLSVPGGTTPPSVAAVPNPAGVVAETVATTPVASVPNPAVVGTSPFVVASVPNPGVVGASPIPVAAVRNPAQVGAFGPSVESLVGGFSFGSSLTSEAITVANQTLSGGFSFASSLASLDVAIQQLSGGFSFGSRIDQDIDWGDDPRTGRPEYLVVVSDRFGNRYGTLTPRRPGVSGSCTLAPLTDGVNVPDSWSFRLHRSDPKSALVKPIEREVQLWRGNVLLSKGPIGPGRDVGDGWNSYDVSDPRWYMWGGRRVIGRIPRLNVLRNGDFTSGLAYWTPAYDAGSAPEAPPHVEIVEEPEAPAGVGVLIEGVDKVVTSKTEVETAAVFVPNSATYLPGGAAKITAAAASLPNGSDLHVVGHTAYAYIDGDYGNGLALSLDRAQAARATLAGMGKGFTFSLPPGWSSIDPSRRTQDSTVGGRGRYAPVSSNDTHAGQAKNRRIEIQYSSTQTATGHRQYLRQYVTASQPSSLKVPMEYVFAGTQRLITWLGAPKDGWAVKLIVTKVGAPTVEVDSAEVTMDEKTPRERTHAYTTSVEVPADGLDYRIEVRLYPPAGQCTWFECGLFPQEQLGYFDVDQASIVKGLVQHAQDTTKGHGALGILTRTPLTGIKRTKEYPLDNTLNVETAIDWFTSIAHGLDVDCEVTPETATIATHYPRQGSSTAVFLTTVGRDPLIKTYKPLTSSVQDLASSIIMQAGSTTGFRAERYARKATALGGTLLERVVTAEEETPIAELDEGAVAALRIGLRPTPGWEVTLDPDRTSDMLRLIRKGDTVHLEIPEEGVSGIYRMVLRNLDPDPDALTLTLIEED